MFPHSSTLNRTKLTLRNSRQIRPPIYSLKQSKLRKRRVVRYAILYFLMFALFLILIVGPAIVGRFVGTSITGAISLPMNLLQPVNWNHNDTSGKQTGTATQGGAGGASGTSSAPFHGFSSSTAGHAKRTAVFAMDMYR
jgi:1,3-beta-glucan synthase